MKLLNYTIQGAQSDYLKSTRPGIVICSNQIVSRAECNVVPVCGNHQFRQKSAKFKFT